MRYAPPLFEVDPLSAGICLLACAACVLLWRRQHALTARALAEAQRQIIRLSASQQSLRDAERRRIARDLHDDLGQQLLALSYDASALAARHPELRQPLGRLEERIQQANRALRDIVQDLPPEALAAGLQGAVQRQLDLFSRLSGIRCRLEAEPAAFAAPRAGGVDAVLYRVLQESLSNIVRHAQASEVSIALSREEHRLRLTVRDNGVGLPPAPARRGRSGGNDCGNHGGNHGGGSGLRGIAQRVSAAGGRLDIASTPGAGTALTMSFPI